MKSKMLTKLLASALALGSGSAFALQETTTIAVSAEVTVACTIAATPLNFASFNVLAGTNVDTTSTVTATCTNGSGYSIGLGAGDGASATVSTRKMTHTTDNTKTLNYGLYLDAGRTTNWDDIGGTNVKTGTGSGVAQAYTVYGRVPSGQTAPIVGSYADTVQVTIDF